MQQSVVVLSATINFRLLAAAKLQPECRLYNEKHGSITV